MNTNLTLQISFVKLN